jgi:hypothetical protein
MGKYLSKETNDEENIVVSKGKDYGSNEMPLFRADLKSSQNFYVLDSERPTEVISSLELEGIYPADCQRITIDLVLVIDVSGSMTGEKIKLVKKTMNFLLTQLQENDRISIITFSNSASKICGLRNASISGKQRLESLIDSLTAKGGTNLVAGLQLGLQVLKSRKIINTNSGIILLTDGIDSKGVTSIERAKGVIEGTKIPGDYTIHTFGYGNDHDFKLLNSISDLKNGGFYYIQKFDNIAEAFANCHGELISVLFESIQVTLETQACSAPFKLKKVFSDSGDNSFKVNSILKGMKKEVIFIIELEFCEFQQDELCIQPVRALVNYKDVRTKQVQNTECLLSIIIKNPKTNDKIITDIDCLTNYYRFKTAEAIKEADQFAGKNELEMAREEIQKCINDISQTDIAETELGKIFIQDLEQSKRNFENRERYVQFGQVDNMKKMKNHINKRGEDIGAYQNRCQKEVIFNSKGYFSKKF